ncbi:MAG: aldolase/citrate lyase family protein [Pseudomonadota bacterium]
MTVRINPCWVPAMRDLEASVIAGVSAIQLPLCETPAQALAVAGAIGELEAERGLEPGAIGLIAMLESAGAVIRAPQIAAATPRLAALTLGVEDYAASMGAEASHALLRPAAQQVTQAARAADIASYAVAAGMSDFRDVEALRSAAQEARALGATGGYAVHPAQVAILNAVFAPTEAEIDWARRALAGAEAAAQDGRGVFVLDGRMIDLPLVKRARAILKTAAVSKGKHQS